MFTLAFTAKDLNPKHTPSPLSLAYNSLSSSDEKMSAVLSLSREDRTELFRDVIEGLTPSGQRKILKWMRRTFRKAARS